MDTATADTTSLGYLAARLRAMKGELIPGEKLDELLEAHDVSVVIEFLVNSPYSHAMAEALAVYEGPEAVEEAVTRNLEFNLRKLYRMPVGETAPLVKVFLRQYDLLAVKSLLRVRHQDVGGEEAERSFSPGPTLTLPVMRDMLASSGAMEDLVNRLILWNPKLCGTLGKSIQDYIHDNRLSTLEESLDRAYYSGTVRKLRDHPDENAQLIRKALQMEIDRINLRIFFELSQAGLSPEERAEMILPGGGLAANVIEAIEQAASATDVMEAIQGTMYGELVERFYEFLVSQRFAPVERLFDFIMVRHLHQLSMRHPLSVALLTYYAWAKFNEVINLRLIARGHARHLPAARVREEMVVV